MSGVNEEGVVSVSKLARLVKRLSGSFLVIDGVVFFRSGRATVEWARQRGITMSSTSRQPRAKVYVSALAWVRWRRGRKTSTDISVDAVFVTPLHRLGNAVHQLGNAALVAEALDVTDVVIAPNDTFTKPVSLGVGRRLGFRLRAPRHRLGGRAVLVGRFFWDNEFPEICLPEKIPAALSGLTSSVMARDTIATVSQDTLVIHVRGGDVFDSRPSRRYGQPPFAFYETVIGSRAWDGVMLVSEDTANPVHALITDYCEKSGIPLTPVSGDLLSDVSVLLGATHLVVSAGTFGRAMVLLSDTVRHVYEFEKSAWLYPLEPQVTLHRVVDTVAGYRDAVMAGNWDNSDEQRRLMAHYPKSALRVLPPIQAES